MLADADALLVREVYAAGESPIAGADSRALCRAIRLRGRVDPVFAAGSDAARLCEVVTDLVEDGDVVLTLGAGDIGKCAGRAGGALGRGRGWTKMSAAMRQTPPRASRAPSTPRQCGTFREAESMARHTVWGIGGVADRFYAPADVEDLARFVAELPADEPVLMLGLGSNLLVRDGGFRGTVISTGHALAAILQIDGSTLRVQAGVACPKVARYSVRHGLAGCEFFAGIPGTVGGALAMNAGAFGGETWTIVRSVETLDRHGEIRRRAPADFEVAYRQVKGPVDEWFLAADLSLEADPRGLAGGRLKELLRARAQSQPMGRRSCGSVFPKSSGRLCGSID